MTLHLHYGKPSQPNILIVSKLNKLNDQANFGAYGYVGYGIHIVILHKV